MEEKHFELIDKYLRQEMTAEESLLFEQEALNDDELRSEIELTYRIKRRLSDRQQKLHKTAHWKRKKKYELASIASVTSIAAAFIIGFFLNKPMPEVGAEVSPIASTVVNTPQELKEMSEKAIDNVKKNISVGKEDVAIAEVERLEEQNIIPSLINVSSGQFVMSQTMDSSDADVLIQDAYELHWLKIKSLMAIGKKKEATQLLYHFVRIEGEHQATADSLLRAVK